MRLPVGEQELLVQDILAQLKDAHSQEFYELVAAKVPGQIVRQALAEIKADGAVHPARVFTYRMNQYALEQLRHSMGQLPHRS